MPEEVKCSECSYWIPKNEAFYSHSDIDEDHLLVFGDGRISHTYLCEDCAINAGLFDEEAL